MGKAEVGKLDMRFGIRFGRTLKVRLRHLHAPMKRGAVKCIGAEARHNETLRGISDT